MPAWCMISTIWAAPARLCVARSGPHLQSRHLPYPRALACPHLLILRSPSPQFEKALHHVCWCLGAWVWHLILSLCFDWLRPPHLVQVRLC